MRNEKFQIPNSEFRIALMPRAKWGRTFLIYGEPAAEYEMLTKAVQFLNRETDIVEDASEQAFFERSPSVEGDRGAAVVRDSLERTVTSASVRFFKAEFFEDGDQFTGGQNGEFLTAHAWRGSAPGLCRRILPALEAAAHRL